MASAILFIISLRIKPGKGCSAYRYSLGREESQVIHLNPQSGRWVPDDTHLQRHVNAAIAYNVWQYYQVSRDMEFLSFFGAELFLQIARSNSTLLVQ